MKKIANFILPFIALSAISFQVAAKPDMKEIDDNATTALNSLYEQSSMAKTLGSDAKGMLIFPSVTKASLGVGGERGHGVLRVGGKSVDYYTTTAASVGLQAGVSSSSRVIFFLEQEALDKFRSSEGWEVGVDANITVMEVGKTVEGTTTNIKDPIVAFVFGEKGLMAGISLEGSKYTKQEK